MYLMKSAIFCHWLVYFGKTSRLTLKPSSVKKIPFRCFFWHSLSINRSVFYMPSGHLATGINCLRGIFCSIHVHLHTKLNPKRIQILTQASQVMPVIHRQQPIQASYLTIFKKGFVSGVSPFFFIFILFLLTKLLCIGFNIWYIKVVDPSFELKQRTVAGVTKVKRRLDKTKITGNFNLPPRRLQSGSLKPLGRPMTASGPLMRNCQGILAGRSIGHVCPVLRAL